MSGPGIWECQRSCLRPMTDLPKLPREEIRNVVRENLRSGYPVAIGWVLGLGWFVIETGGQGPYFVWREWVDG